MEAYESKIDFGELLIKNKLLTKEEVKKLYDLSYYTKNMDKVFGRLGII